ncbi:MAG: bifunctional DNA primase/polymerase [Candidatus Brocadia sinica]|nr:bifunctional DNA primase/polymerase [Candidatus Brocadia sinica]
MKSIVDSAIGYLKQGFSVIPSNPKTKAPLVPWTEYQNRLPSEDEICSWFKQHPKAMLSLVTGEFSGITVVDADSEEAISRIEEVLPESLELPCVRTPRDGRHFYFAYDPSIPTKAGILPNTDTRSDGGCCVCPPSSNSSGRKYTWLDGFELSREALQPMPDSLHALLTETQSQPWLTCDLKGAPLINKHTYIRGCNKSVTTCESLFERGRRDSDLFHLALTLRKGGESPEYILQVLKNIALTWGEENEIKWLSEKVESAFRREERKVEDISRALDEWMLLQTGYFNVTSCYNELHLVTPKQKTAVRVTLSRRVKENVLERHPDRSGIYRKLDTTLEEINWQDAKVSPLNIRWPFQIENLVRILPKNIIVIAGETDAGKTGFLLNFVRMNMSQHEIFYFSSEMGGEEMKDRISYFDLPFDQWRFKAYERSCNFADVIRPDSVNIIDYIEMSDDFYKISGYIKSIFDKLRNGIAIIALQKNPKIDYGLGGMRSAEKARLYLSMEPGRCKIVKAKNWVDHTKNPNKLVIEYSLAKGYKFIPKSGWKKE